MLAAQRIMVVEDELSAAQLFKRWLSSVGYDVVTAPTAENALTRLAQQHYDLVLTDVDLPGRSGLDLTRILHDRYPKMPVVVTTGHRSLDVASAAVSSGALSFILKPMNKQMLVERISSTFGWLARSQTALAIGAHSHNVESGCGGTLLRHHQAGHQVVILSLSRGTAGEAERSAQQLGAKLRQENMEDALPRDLEGATRVIRQAVQELRPTWVYTHCAEDTHPSHRMIHQATLAATVGIPNLFCYQTHATTPDFHPTRFVDIGSQLMAKQQALQSYTSQLVQRPFLQPDMVQASAAYWGRFAGYRMVEPFTVIREDLGT